jgi:shikimate dehydrogenase
VATEPRPPVERRSPRWPSAASTIVGVIGDPVRHSWSPLLHNAAFDALGLDWVSVAFEVPAAAASAAFEGARALGVAGLSVTMPHKEAAAAAVDERTEVATRLSSVNCISRVGDRLVGDSTDGPGLIAALGRGPGFVPSGRVCLVVGAGPAARAVILALADAGAAEVIVVNRSPDRAQVAAGLATGRGRVGGPADVAGADLVVNATPLGMGAGGPSAPAYPIDLEDLHAGQVVVDLVYHPAVTPLLARAAAAGAVVANGLGMLVHQAAIAIETWTGRPAPLEAMWAAAETALGTGQ